MRYPCRASRTSSTTDYEQPTYDVASNVSARQLRDGNGIARAYDPSIVSRPRTCRRRPDITSTEVTPMSFGRLTSAAGYTTNTLRYEAFVGPSGKRARLNTRRD